MKAAFINVALRPDSKRRMLPVGLAYVMTAAKRAGFDFELFDMDINLWPLDALEKKLSADVCDVYCLGCVVTGYKLVKDIAAAIKRINPKSVVIAGNSVADSISSILLRNTMVDIAVIGEADLTIVELFKALRDETPLGDVRGIVFKDKNGELAATAPRAMIDDIDTLGFPEWDIFDLEKYDTYGKINTNYADFDAVMYYPLNSARGCPFNCTFCYHVFKGKKYRRYSEPVIVKEIERLHDRFGCNYVGFWDELTFFNIDGVRRRMEAMAGLNFKIAWSGAIRGNLFTKKDAPLLKDLKESGCQALGFSLENADPRILKAINKKIDVAQFIEQAHVMHDAGLTPLTSVIFGYPQETPETIQATIDVCERAHIFPSVGFLLPLPGTPIYNWACRQGYIKDEVNYLNKIGDRQDLHVNLTSMPDDKFVDIVTGKLRKLSDKQGLKLDSVLKTVTYKTPKSKENRL